jgi:RNA polymerase sigma-70 factor (ECF subfamily)
MASYARGDAAAFDELFRRYERRIHGFLLHRTASPERAADLFQEAFLRLHRFRDRFDPGQSFSRWIFQIARNVWIDDVRRAFRAPVAGLGAAPEPSTPADAEGRASAREELAVLLRDLSDEQAAILLAAKGAGAPYLELAGELGKSAAAVRQTASRALRRLRAARAAARAPWHRGRTR